MRHGNFSEEDKQRMAGRIRALEGVWIKLKATAIPRDLRSHLRLDPLRLTEAIGAYWNDLNRLKARHDINERLHRAKVAAYTIKWILAYSPVVCVADEALLLPLPEEHKTVLLEANSAFAAECLFYFADALDPKEFAPGGRFERVMRDIAYYFGTGGYQEKMASVLFQALIIASSDQNHERQ